jgi:hypothetical protein
MNKVTKRKLGLAQSDAKQEAQKIAVQLSETTPISLEKAVKDYTSNSNINLKTINIGTLRNPVEKLAIYDDTTKGYYPIDVKVKQNSEPIYFSEESYVISLNNEVLNYHTNLNIDQQNPYDPLFSSFDRLYSLEPQIVSVSGVTGLLIGDKQRFFNIMSGFTKSTTISVTGAGSDLNGTFSPTSQFINGRTRYLNASLPFPAAIIWSTSASGWVINQTSTAGRTTPALRDLPRYFLNSTGLIPTGNNWVLTGLGSISGVLPSPTSFQKDFEGFFKIANSRVSAGKARIFAAPIGATGLSTGQTTGNSLTFNNSWVTYPHSYNVESYQAFRYPISITFAENTTGLHDILVISTGIQDKKIIYVSPHTIEQFQGFWSTQLLSNRSGENKFISRLSSGNLITVSSEHMPITGLDSYILSGVGGSGIYNDFYNFNSAVLTQSTPLSQTLFYKLYEPVYKKFTFNTGVWNGIIPSGVPFSIETIRTKNSDLKTPKLSIHVRDTFVNVSPSGSGNYQFIRPFNSEDYIGNGYFEGTVIAKNSKSIITSNYTSALQSKRKAKSKLYGYLWEKGLTVDNSKVKKTVKLFGTKVTPSGVNGQQRKCQDVEDTSNPLSCSYTGTLPAKPRYCLPYENPSDPLSCSYTGVVRGAFGIPTSAGLRTLDQNSNLLRNVVDEDGNLIKFIPIVES